MDDELTKLAGCILLDDYGRILLLHRYTGEGQWELPGGKLEAGEAPEVAAVRELHEALGVQVVLTYSLGSAEFEQNDTSYKYYWYAGKLAQGSNQPGVQETRLFDDFDYFEIDDLASLALSPGMQIFYEKLLSGEVVLEP